MAIQEGYSSYRNEYYSHKRINMSGSTTKSLGWYDEAKNVCNVITTFAIGFMLATPVLGLLAIIFLN